LKTHVRKLYAWALLRLGNEVTICKQEGKVKRRTKPKVRQNPQ